MNEDPTWIAYAGEDLLPTSKLERVAGIILTVRDRRFWRAREGDVARGITMDFVRAGEEFRFIAIDYLPGTPKREVKAVPVVKRSRSGRVRRPHRQKYLFKLREVPPG